MIEKKVWKKNEKIQLVDNPVLLICPSGANLNMDRLNYFVCFVCFVYFVILFSPFRTLFDSPGGVQ